MIAGKMLIWILWPSFIVAGIAEGIFFTLFDPTDLTLFDAPIQASRRAETASWEKTSGPAMYPSAITPTQGTSGYKTNRGATSSGPGTCSSRHSGASAPNCPGVTPSSRLCPSTSARPNPAIAARGR